MTDAQQRTTAKQFAKDWQGRGDEKQETQAFWLALLQKVFDVAEPEKFVAFELPVKLSHTSFIDGYIEETGVLIEQKGRDIDLCKGSINGYLLDADNVFVESRSKPLCDVPVMSLGNQSIDGGFYSFTEREKAEFVAKEPAAEQFFRPWMGSKEFINRIPRYFLYLRECGE